MDRKNDPKCPKNEHPVKKYNSAMTHCLTSREAAARKLRGFSRRLKKFAHHLVYEIIPWMIYVPYFYSVAFRCKSVPKIIKKWT